MAAEDQSIFVFPANNNTYRSRKRILKACEACRRGRKKCIHDGSEPSSPPKRTRVSVEQVEVAAIGPDDGSNDSGMRRFLGDTNPEAILSKKLPGVEYHDTIEGMCGNGVGIWGKHLTPNVTSSPFTRRNSTVLLPKSTQDVLHDIYLTSIQPFLPLCTNEWLEQAYPKGQMPYLLQLAMNLVSAKDPRAFPHLRLTGDGPVLPAVQFCSEVYHSITYRMSINPPRNRLLLIQIEALLSLHYEGQDGVEQSSMHLSHAIHHAHTIGLQIERPASDPSALSFREIFWCLWSLDKVNSCIGGRPLLMFDRDMGQKKYFLGDAPLTPHICWLRIANLLEMTIEYYRPDVDKSVTGWEDNFPSFEDVFGGSDVPDFSASQLVFYSVVSILTSRARSVTAKVVSTPSVVRQAFSSLRVVAIINDYKDQLPSLPVVPYAASLALCIAYKACRQARISTQIDRSQREVETACTLLEQLGDRWSSATAMAKLGRGAVRAVEAARAESSTPNSLPTRTETTPVYEPPASSMLRKTDTLNHTNEMPLQLNEPEMFDLSNFELGDADFLLNTYVNPTYPFNIGDLVPDFSIYPPPTM